MSSNSPKPPREPKPARQPKPPKPPKPAAGAAATTRSAAGTGPGLSRGLKVRATMDGYYGDIRRREGDVFLIANEEAFSTRWMEYVDARTPEKVTTGQQVINRKHDEQLGGAASRTDNEAAGEATAGNGKAGHGGDVI